jgi:uncharacterized membrane protein YgcG
VISPADVKVQIYSSLRKVREEQNRAEAAWNSVSQKITGIEESRLHAYKALAKMRLDEIVAGTVVDELNAAEQKARAKFDVFLRLCDQAQVERHALDAQIAQAQETRAQIESQIAASQAEIDALTSSTRQRLSGETGWAALLRAVNTLDQKLKAADKKAQESEADRENKSAPYLADDVFKYLYEKKFGTAAYTGSGWVRWGDERVAQTIGFESARRDFVMLNELPVRLRAHVDGLRQTLDAQVAETEKQFRAETEKDGIGVPEGKLRAQNLALEALIQRTDTLLVALQQNQARYESLTDGNDENGLNAVLAILVTALQRRNLTELMQKAAATPEPEDDEIVRDLEKLKTGLADAQAELRECRVQLNVLKARAALLEEANAHMEKSGSTYDGTFQNEDGIRDVIDKIYLGQKAVRDLKALLAANFVRRPPPPRESSYDSDWGWSSSSSRDSSSSSFGGFGGGGFSTGGGSGGGGFRTGGGF